jgi:hypothetical protein
LKLVVSLAPNATTARRCLDDFLASGESMLTVNLDDLDSLLTRPRARWAGGKSLIPGQERTASTEGSAMNETEFEKKLGTIERHLHTLSEVILASDDAEKHVVASLVNTVRDLVGLRTAAERGEELAHRVLATIEEIADRVDTLEQAGQPFDADAVRHDLHKMASRIVDIASDGESIGSSFEELNRIQRLANQIRPYFV